VLLWAQLRRSNADASEGTVEALEKIVSAIRERLPGVKIVVRADSGFSRESIMAWCEGRSDVFYLIGMARNSRLEQLAGPATLRAAASFCLNAVASRSYMETPYRISKSWSCGRGNAENMIKQMVLDLDADRTSCSWMAANQMRLWFSSFAYLILERVRTIGLAGSSLAQATLGGVRLRLLKVAALVKISVRRVHVALCSPFPPAGYFPASGASLGEMRFSKSRIEKTLPECSLESDRETPQEASRTQTIKNGPQPLAESEKLQWGREECPAKREKCAGTDPKWMILCHARLAS
jgi:hypothetical protein